MGDDQNEISYSAVKSSILEIAAELDKLEDNSELNNDDDDTRNSEYVEYAECKNESKSVFKEEVDPIVTEVVSISEEDPCLIKFSTAERDKRRKEKKNARNKEWSSRQTLKGRKRHKCDECGAMVVLLTKHKLTHAPKIACEICGKMVQNGTMKSHMLIHKTPEVKCDQCDYLTVSERLKGHVERCHGPKNFACELCGSQFGTSVSLQSHIKGTHNTSLNCSYCKFQTSSKDSLKKHMMYKHEKSANCVCVLCSFETLDKETLETHIRECHGGVGLEKIENKPKRRYDCDLCDYKGTGKNALRLHKNSKHFGIRFNCDLCDFTSTQKGLLKRHTDRVHLGIKFPCKFCESEFSNQGSLRMHMISKHPDEYQIFSCHLCNYRTESKDMLQRHLTGKYGKHNQ